MLKEFIVITYLFNACFIPFDYVSVQNNKQYVENATGVQFQLGIELLDSVTIYGGEKTAQKKEQGELNFIPYGQNYYVGAEYHKDINGMKLQVGCLRSCTHPLNLWNRNKYLQNYNSASFEIYIQMSGKIKIW